jgi:hypothetical protein
MTTHSSQSLGVSDSPYPNGWVGQTRSAVVLFLDRGRRGLPRVEVGLGSLRSWLDIGKPAVVKEAGRCHVKESTLSREGDDLARHGLSAPNWRAMNVMRMVVQPCALPESAIV